MPDGFASSLSPLASGLFRSIRSDQGAQNLACLITLGVQGLVAVTLIEPQSVCEGDLILQLPQRTIGDIKEVQILRFRVSGGTLRDVAGNRDSGPTHL